MIPARQKSQRARTKVERKEVQELKIPNTLLVLSEFYLEGSLCQEPSVTLKLSSHTEVATVMLSKQSQKFVNFRYTTTTISSCLQVMEFLTKCQMKIFHEESGNHATKTSGNRTQPTAQHSQFTSNVALPSRVCLRTLFTDSRLTTLQWLWYLSKTSKDKSLERAKTPKEKSKQLRLLTMLNKSGLTLLILRLKALSQSKSKARIPSKNLKVKTTTAQSRFIKELIVFKK
jgi:hypothetical protein